MIIAPFDVIEFLPFAGNLLAVADRHFQTPVKEMPVVVILDFAEDDLMVDFVVVVLGFAAEVFAAEMILLVVVLVDSHFDYLLSFSYLVKVINE